VIEVMILMTLIILPIQSSRLVSAILARSKFSGSYAKALFSKQGHVVVAGDIDTDILKTLMFEFYHPANYHQVRL
jgi:hypothetical protein